MVPKVHLRVQFFLSHKYYVCILPLRVALSPVSTIRFVGLGGGDMAMELWQAAIEKWRRQIMHERYKEKVINCLDISMIRPPGQVTPP